MKTVGEKLLICLMLVILLIPLMCISERCIAQEPANGVFPIKDSVIYYEKIANIDSLSKDQIYKSIKSWGVNAFVSQKDVVQADDKESGLIAYKFFFTQLFSPPKIWGLGTTTTIEYWCVLKVFIKDNKIKITVTDLSFKNAGSYGTTSTSILHYRRDYEEMLKKSLMGKNYRDKLYDSLRTSFIDANYHITNLINNVVTAAKSGKGDFDF